MTTAFDRFKLSLFLALAGGYLILGYSFMQLRIPPASFGVPLGELLLVLALLSIDPWLVLLRMRTQVVLIPFMLWWGWGFTRLAFDTADRGFWALRDATQLIESLFLIVGFSLAADPCAIPRLARWLRRILIVASVYGLLYIFGDEIAAISPTLSGASDQPVPLFGASSTSGSMLLWAAFACLIAPAHRQQTRMFLTLAAGIMIAFSLVVIQARTTYLQLFVLAGLLLFYRPRALGRLGVTIPLFVILLLIIDIFDVRISGRLTSEISLSFFWDHLQAIFGIGAQGHGAVAAAAEGIPLRLHWWYRLYEQLTADPIAFLTGLGFGIPLTDFRDTLGVVTREPHNSAISVAARLGLIGIASWIWMQIELFRAGFRAYRDSHRIGCDEAAHLVLLILAFALLTLVGCIGEDNMEKPYYAIPYYAFWGFVLRIAHRLRTEVWYSRPVYRAGQSAHAPYPRVP